MKYFLQYLYIFTTLVLTNRQLKFVCYARTVNFHNYYVIGKLTFYLTKDQTFLKATNIVVLASDTLYKSYTDLLLQLTTPSSFRLFSVTDTRDEVIIELKAEDLSKEIKISSILKDFIGGTDGPKDTYLAKKGHKSINGEFERKNRIIQKIKFKKRNQKNVKLRKRYSDEVAMLFFATTRYNIYMRRWFLCYNSNTNLKLLAKEEYNLKETKKLFLSDLDSQNKQIIKVIGDEFLEYYIQRMIKKNKPSNECVEQEECIIADKTGFKRKVEIDILDVLPEYKKANKQIKTNKAIQSNLALTENVLEKTLGKIQRSNETFNLVTAKVLKTKEDFLEIGLVADYEENMEEQDKWKISNNVRSCIKYYEIYVEGEKKSIFNNE